MNHEDIPDHDHGTDSRTAFSLACHSGYASYKAESLDAQRPGAGAGIFPNNDLGRYFDPFLHPHPNSVPEVDT